MDMELDILVAGAADFTTLPLPSPAGLRHWAPLALVLLCLGLDLHGAAPALAGPTPAMSGVPA